MCRGFVRVVLHEAERIRDRPRHAHRHAPQMGIVGFVLGLCPQVHQLLRQGQQWQRLPCFNPCAIESRRRSRDRSGRPCRPASVAAARSAPADA